MKLPFILPSKRCSVLSQNKAIVILLFGAPWCVIFLETKRRQAYLTQRPPPRVWISCCFVLLCFAFTWKCSLGEERQLWRDACNSGVPQAPAVPGILVCEPTSRCWEHPGFEDRHTAARCPHDQREVRVLQPASHTRASRSPKPGSRALWGIMASTGTCWRGWQSVNPAPQHRSQQSDREPRGKSWPCMCNSSVWKQTPRADTLPPFSSHRTSFLSPGILLAALWYCDSYMALRTFWFRYTSINRRVFR